MALAEQNSGRVVGAAGRLRPDAHAGAGACRAGGVGFGVVFAGFACAGVRRHPQFAELAAGELHHVGHLGEQLELERALGELHPQGLGVA